LVAVAVFPGWSKSAEVLGTFVILDQVAAQFVEPFLIGHGIGVSPVALLFSAMYWAWVWGPAGLLLATPLTACLKVAGDYIPALGFLAVLLGDDRASQGYQEYYRKLLELDQAGANSLAISYCNEHGLEPTFNDIICPALMLMGEERDQDHIGAENQQFIVNATREIIANLGNRLDRPYTTPRLRVLGICPPPEIHSVGLLIFLELVRQDGAAANFAGEGKSTEELGEFAKRFAPDVVCLSCTMMECLQTAAQLIRALKADLPQLMIIAGGRAAQAQPATLLTAGCSRVCRNNSEGRSVIRRYGLRRARLRIVEKTTPTEGMRR
jgi:methanogenic corrinoid protein MtbC1